MVWQKINDCIEMWQKPVLGSEEQKDGKRYMALCIDSKSKKPYRGIAREITKRQGTPDIPGFKDNSKLIIVESDDLLNWRIKGDLNIEGLDDVLTKLIDEKKDMEFVGLEDPDIIVDDKNIHLYFTIPFKYKNIDWYDVYVGHAKGESLDNLKANMPVLKRLNSEVVGFKEICFSEVLENNQRLMLAETFLDRGKSRKYSAISVSVAKDLSSNWDYLKLVHDPEKESREWCSGYSSPCRFFDSDFLGDDKYLVGLMNGRESSRVVDNNKFYGKFRPGLFLFSKDSMEFVWVDDEPLFEDPVATTITFASELIYLNKDEAILYAHPNDSFVRAYKLNLERIKKRIPKEFL